MDLTVFSSDNLAGVHPAILQSLLNVNAGRALPYGDDEYTERAIECFKAEFGDVAAFLTFNGTGTNVIALQTCLQTFEAVICSEHAHIACHECGAPEHYLGCKLIAIPSADGKISPAMISELVKGVGSIHYVQPRVVSVTQPTELGAVYSVAEMKTLADFCRQHGFYLHVDGARICNAVAALGVSFKEMITDCGVDVLSFGGTKNGAMFAEAVVFLNPELSKYAGFIRKQSMQLASKMRYIAAQFITFFENNRWLENAANANRMAALLAEHLQKLPGVAIDIPVKANLFYARFPSDKVAAIQQRYKLLPMNDKLRFVTAFTTKEEHVHEFIIDIKENFFNEKNQKFTLSL